MFYLPNGSGSIGGIKLVTGRNLSTAVDPGMVTLDDRQAGLSKTLVGVIGALPFIYAFNIMFFVPEGDEFFRWTLLPSILIGLYQRYASGIWALDRYRQIFWPLVCYTVVLVALHLFQGGYESTAKSFLFICLYFYFAQPFALKVGWIVYLPLFSAAELLMLSLYQVHIEGLTRVGGFTNPLFLAMFGFCVMLLNLYLAEKMHGRFMRYLYFIAAVASLYVVMLTLSRGIILAIVPVFVLYVAFVLAKLRFGPARLPQLAVFLLAMTAVLVTSNAAMQRFSLGVHNFNQNTSDNGVDLAHQANSVGFRLMMWDFSLAAVANDPVLGLGKDRFEEEKKAFVDAGRVHSSMQALFLTTHAHNQYIQELVMRGLLGLFALLALFAFHLNQARLLIAENRWVGYALVSIVLSFMVFGLTEVSLKHEYKVVTYFMSILLMLNALQTCRTEKKMCSVDSESAR